MFLVGLKLHGMFSIVCVENGCEESGLCGRNRVMEA